VTDPLPLPPLNPIDAAGLSLVQALSGRSEVFDWALRFLLTVDLAKLGVPVLCAVYAWLAEPAGVRPAQPAGVSPAQPAGENPAARSRRVLGSLAGVILTIAFGRFIQDSMPPRDRPRLTLPPEFFPQSAALPTLGEWSSFPSDHAVLAAALATAAWAFSRRLGLVAALWAALVVCFPRLYFGFHYLTDLLAGAALGVGLTRLIMALPWPEAPLRGFARLQRHAPALLSLAVFLIAYEFITLFATTRRVLGAVKDVVHALG
jgi:membrane-associated phospholipid phosphatase